MAEEPSLPCLPAVSWVESSQSFSNNPRKRVRHPRSGGLYNSSDPAVFSSDDDPGLDNYVEGRKKKRYVGSWFQQQPTSSDSTFGERMTAPKPKRKLARQFDSGIYLGSDGTEGDDLASEILEMPLRCKLPQLHEQPQRRTTRAVSKAELLAREKIRSCLEQGDETIDLWSMGLEEITKETLGPLENFSCIPVVAKDVAFEQKDPELKIYLTMNRLGRVSGTLFDLEYLTILSLRGNKLTEIPPAIAKLSNLKQLNLSQNRLRSLPIELLDLFGKNLGDVVLHPNPFFEPERQLCIEGDDGSEHLEQPLLTRHLGRSPLQMADSMGRILSEFKFPSYQESNKLSVASGNHPDKDTNSKASRVASLMEIALRSCYSTSQLSELQRFIPEGLSHLRELLERAARQKDMGGMTCSQCRRLIIVPSLEWVEWRDIRTREVSGDTVSVRPLSLGEDEQAVPFLHRACSWTCGPDA
ncbi:Leucine Rich Repeat domain protein [Metarhizium album ARSEF 1941]|uniref:Leucine Rich Repeat domain protein n=1 Tax=Metarhizium album (strain ARSEF 1941) TaxID=1081103 RepID=A0A0B2X4M0_METAS|nr:Leucine Rich Repeat domain protein [Metarhizium album ARSEF 1941]KHO01279.1 Leucine Rich Repeat domain protein [Metarhizium album ARSEF 1941]